MGDSQLGPKYDLRGAQFAGGIATNVYGNQLGGNINNCARLPQNVTQLLSGLRKQAEDFPSESRQDALDTINDLERGISQSNYEPSKVARQLKRLVSIASAIGTMTGGIATFSGELKDFTENVAEIAQVIDITLD